MASSESLTTDRSEEAAASTAETEAKPQGGLRNKVMRAAYWTVSERLLSQVIRLGGSIILSRLLFPEAFGISATISVFQEALLMFTDFGTGDIVIQHRDGDTPAFLNTVWTFQVLRGFAMAIVTIAISWPFAYYWLEKPELAPMLAVSSLQLAINGFLSIKLPVAVREMILGSLTIRNLLSQVIGLLALIILAFWLRSAWALVIGQIVSSLCNVILSYAMMPGPSNWFGLDRTTLKYVRTFGGWVFLSTLLTFVAIRGDSFLMASYLNVAMFGIYNIANTLSGVPTMSVEMLGSRIVYPLLSQIARDDRSRLPATYDRSCSMLYLLSLPAIGLLAGTAPTIVRILFDSRYWEAGWITQILAIRAALNCLFIPGRFAVMTLGFPRYSAIAQASRAALLVIGLPLAYTYYGIVGATMAAAFNGVAAVLVIQWGLYENGLFKLSRELKGLGMLLISTAAGFGVDHILSRFF